MSEAIVLHVNSVIKARKVEADGKRFVEVQASSEDVDSEGDVILQSALLDSADSFIKSGHLDLDHISEIGPRMGIPDATSYIIGRPTEVKDIGDKRTSVVCEISRSMDGTIDIKKNRYDEFWDSMQRDPPVHWQASVYGFPKSDMIDDCTEKSCAHGATRYLIKGIDWRSLAFTRNPVNTSLTGYAKVVTAKAYTDLIRKDYGGMYSLSYPPRSMDELWGNYIRHNQECPMTEGENKRTLFRDHFMGCCGMAPEEANIYAHALMMLVLDESKKRRD